MLYTARLLHALTQEACVSENADFCRFRYPILILNNNVLEYKSIMKMYFVIVCAATVWAVY